MDIAAISSEYHQNRCKGEEKGTGRSCCTLMAIEAALRLQYVSGEEQYTEETIDQILQPAHYFVSAYPTADSVVFQHCSRYSDNLIKGETLNVADLATILDTLNQFDPARSNFLNDVEMKFQSNAPVSFIVTTQGISRLVHKTASGQWYLFDSHDNSNKFDQSADKKNGATLSGPTKDLNTLLETYGIGNAEVSITPIIKKPDANYAYVAVENLPNHEKKSFETDIDTLVKESNPAGQMTGFNEENEWIQNITSAAQNAIIYGEKYPGTNEYIKYVITNNLTQNIPAQFLAEQLSTRELPVTAEYVERNRVKQNQANPTAELKSQPKRLLHEKGSPAESKPELYERSSSAPSPLKAVGLFGLGGAALGAGTGAAIYAGIFGGTSAVFGLSVLAGIAAATGVGLLIGLLVGAAVAIYKACTNSAGQDSALSVSLLPRE